MSETTCREAGQRGGRATAAKYGRAHMAAIAALATPTPDEQRRRGLIGGAVTRATHPLDHYREIGRKGGEATRATHGRAFYAAIGAKGGRGRGPAVGAGYRTVGQ